MPTYDYRCDANDKVVEVRHGMNHRILTWGELCDTAGIEPGRTNRVSPVSRLANGGNVTKSSTLGDRLPQGCNPEGCAGAGGCPMAG
ncbi:MAG: zinc ribbon domain-containing protein [Halieaceae bacterium]|jgi:hypothetical protein|nr:zinc ribbon domain-containing protein [Halieaceae bacterium]